jgi:peroxiredoxin
MLVSNPYNVGMKKTPAVCLLGLLIAIPALSAKNSAVDAANAKSLALVGKLAPGFALQDFQQQSFSLEAERGHVVVLAFWATWCPPCRAELPAFDSMRKELTSTGVELITVAFDDPAKAQDFLAKKNLTLRCLNDQSGSVAALYGAHALPRTFVIGRDGTVTKAYVGKVSASELRSAVAQATKPAVSTPGN